MYVTFLLLFTEQTIEIELKLNWIGRAVISHGSQFFIICGTNWIYKTLKKTNMKYDPRKNDHKY